MNIARRKTKIVNKGSVAIGGQNPISIQSMTNTQTQDVDATCAQIKRLCDAGCEIIRVAVPDEIAAKNLSKIKAQISIPLVADIHFNASLALEAIAQGVDAIRINPGNITDKEKLKEIVLAAKEKNIAIRIGLNSGSVIRKTENLADDMVKSACEYIDFFENLNFTNIVISLKASNIEDTIDAYKKMANKCDYPLHLGITSAGTLRSGTVKSAVGLGILLAQGLGDTIRVSLSHDPVEEVKVAYEILSALGLREKKHAEVISCPTCGRCQVDLIKIINAVEVRLKELPTNKKIAIMGCVVNGPGEAQDADYALTWGGENIALLFKDGTKLKKLEGNIEEIINDFICEVTK